MNKEKFFQDTVKKATAIIEGDGKIECPFISFYEKATNMAGIVPLVQFGEEEFQENKPRAFFAIGEQIKKQIDTNIFCFVSEANMWVGNKVEGDGIDWEDIDIKELKKDSKKVDVLIIESLTIEKEHKTLILEVKRVDGKTKVFEIEESEFSKGAYHKEEWETLPIGIETNLEYLIEGYNN